MDKTGFAVPELSSGRESFSPAAYYDGPLPADRRDFLPGPPTFAVEVRSKNDYGPAAEAGTRVVWDVDPDAGSVRVYRADAPDQPAVYHKGQAAEAEPALPGWRLPVDAIFA
jgi:Uma2 family endonuclease